MVPFVIAHRGVSQNVPENTLPAFLAAVRIGADGVETDVQLTKDGKLVLHHNYTIDACSNGSGAIYQMTYEQLKAYDFGAYAGACWAGTPIATLRDLLEAGRELPIINIELKAPVDRSLPYTQTLVGELKAFGKLDNIIISAFDHSLLAQVKRLCPELKVAALTLPPRFFETRLFRLMEKALPEGCSLLHVTRKDLKELDETETSGVQVDIPGADIKDGITELAHQIGAVFPDSDLEEVKAALERQNDLPEYLCSLGFPVDFSHCHFSAVLKDPTLVTRLKERGILCNVWTPDDPKYLALLVKSGCNGIITNRPEAVLELEGR